MSSPIQTSSSHWKASEPNSRSMWLRSASVLCRCPSLTRWSPSESPLLPFHVEQVLHPRLLFPRALGEGDEGMTPQARATKQLREEGYEVDVVERISRVRGMTWRNDLFGAFDLLAVNAEGDVKAVQVTSRSNVSARCKKLADLPVLSWLRKAGWTLLVMGYGKTKTLGDWKVVDIS